MYRTAFQNYVYNGRVISRLDTTQERYNTLDAYRIEGFVNLIAGAFAATIEGDERHGSVDLDRALEFLAQYPDLIPELTANINSPGSLRFLSDSIAPLVMAVAVALSTAGYADAKPGQIRVVNSAAPPADVCSLQVHDSVQDTFTLMDYNGWKVACKRLNATAKDTGIHTAVSATIVPKDKAKP